MTILPSSFNFNGPFPRQTRRLRLGIVGGGRISQTQAMAARMTDRWDIIAGAFSSDPANAQLRGEDWNVAADRSYTNFQAMAAAEATREDGIDAVMVTTPNHAHYAAARDFLESGIDVICDKLYDLYRSGCDGRSCVALSRGCGCPGCDSSVIWLPFARR